MRIESGYIWLREMHFRAYHGVMAQERKIGADFTVTVRISCDLEKVVTTDCLDDTLDYAAVYELVKREMNVASQLLEHVAGRIGDALIQQFPQVHSVDVWLTKDNPPIGADCSGACVELHLINDKTYC